MTGTNATAFTLGESAAATPDTEMVRSAKAKEGVWACRASAADDRWACDLLYRLGQPKRRSIYYMRNPRPTVAMGWV